MGILKWVCNFIAMVRLPESRGFWISASAFSLVIGFVGLIVLWGWLSGGEFEGEPGSEPRSATIRNIGFIIAGLVTLPLLIWRGVVADKQALAAQRQADIAQQQVEKAQQQVDTAHRQAETAQQGLRNERYQKGADMLGSKVLSVRMGGIYALQRLAREHPEEYHIQIMRLLCAFVRRPTADKDYETELYNNIRDKLHHNIEGPVAREDVQDAMQAIGARSEKEVELEEDQKFQLDLSHARLRHMNLRDRSLTRRTNLTGAYLYNADLFDANLISVDLTNAWFRGANLSEAKLFDAVLFKSDLMHARVSETVFDGVKGLTQNQLDQARRLDPGEPRPDLHGAFDAVSGEQLEWKGGL